MYSFAILEEEQIPGRLETESFAQNREKRLRHGVRGDRGLAVPFSRLFHALAYLLHILAETGPHIATRQEPYRQNDQND
jgi:hypothetical protein